MKCFCNPLCLKNLSPDYSFGTLLFPTHHKNYSQDPIISMAWSKFEKALVVGSLLTIIGYGAPKSDVDAISLISKFWSSRDANLKEIQIVDVKSEDEIFNSWRDVTYSHHFTCHKNVYSIFLFQFPRRSNSAYLDQFFQCRFLNGSHGFRSGMTFKEAIDFVAPLIEEENAVASDGRDDDSESGL